MENSKMKEKFEEWQRKLEEEQKLLQNKYSSISTMRIITFLAGATLFIIGVADVRPLVGIVGGILLGVFFYLVKKHSNVVAKTQIVTSKLEVVSSYIKRFGDEWRSFLETGEEYLTREDTVAADLDLLGKNSLYQMINVAHTDYGRNRLISDMKLDDLKLDEIEKKNQAVEELMGKTDFAVDFESAGIRLETKKKKINVPEFVQYCKDKEKGYLPIWANVIRIAAPVIVISSIVLWICGVFNYGLPIICFLVTLALSWLTKTVTDSVIMPLYSVNFGVEQYFSMLSLIDKNEFNAPYLKEIKSGISGENGAVNAFKQLKKISQAYNICFNPLIHQIFSGLFLWDFQLAHLVGKWKKKYGSCVANCFENIGCMEELLSLAVVGIVRKTNWADIDIEENETVSLECKDLYHPLISPGQVKSNSATINGGITIITGSNMSGKTTFLRTLAINLALAYMGAPICGNQLKASYMKIFTSMRVTDDVANGISTFYAEILRIKAMAEYRESNKPMMCLIDEIFKGTNSADRIVGAREVITQLSDSKCMTMVSTHDFELCNITDKNGKDAVNYHFEEYYDEDGIKFDYKIKDGRCTTTNARELLRMAGFNVSN